MASEVGCEAMAPVHPSTDQAVSASSRKMTSGSGGAQAKIRWASMTACSWLRLGARQGLGRAPLRPRRGRRVSRDTHSTHIGWFRALPERRLATDPFGRTL